jgi:hypothetical protein
MQGRSNIAMLLAAALVLNSSFAAAEETFGGWLLNFSRQKGVKPVTNRIYLEECEAATSPINPACCRPGHGTRC